jgi:POT family proton-dependent oligopeptide transporter
MVKRRAALDATAPSPTLPAHKRELFGHPVGLYVLFLTELWERFCFYGMRALLVLYVVKHLATPAVAGTIPGFEAFRAALIHVFGPQDDHQVADQIYGMYTAVVYLTPLFGGIMADRWLGQRRSVLVGGIIMAIGEFMLVKDTLFFAGLVTLTVGCGCLKSNVSTQVGSLYAPGDPRRDRAYNIFYVGINLGGLLSPLVCGTLGEKVGWGWGFGSAGVGMIIGVITYVAGQKYLAPDQLAARTAAATKVKPPPFTRTEWVKIIALVVLCALNIPWWGVYEQQGNSLQFWADESTNRHIFAWLGSDWEMPATWFQSVNGVFILLCTPFINRIWLRQAARKKEPSSVTKMALACFLLALSFCVMIGAARVVDSGQKASFAWLVGCSFLLTVGEIYLSPVGLSLVTKISPARIVSMMMGMWFLSSFFGDYLSGYLATFKETMGSSAFFGMQAGISLATGVAMVILLSSFKRAIGDENAVDASGSIPAPPPIA